MKYFILTALVISLYACNDAQSFDQNFNEMNHASMPSSKDNNIKWITLQDQTHRMVMGKCAIPSSWEFRHDIASKTNEAGFHKYFKELTGPSGQVITNLPIGMYNTMIGSNFQSSFQQCVNQKLSRYVSQPQFGQLTKSQRLAASKSFQKATQKAPGLQALEMPFRAQSNGREVTGMVYISLMDQGQFGVFFGEVLFSTQDQLETTQEVYFMTGNTYEENPQYAQLQAQVQQRISAQQRQMAQARSQQSYQAHQQRMANNQRAFDAHQNRMQQRSQMMDQNHQQWMSNFRSSGSTYSNNYSSHDAYIDGIHERQTFNDPYSGQQVQKDGYYDYNYTNGLGDYYRTDDPSFNPNSLQGNWGEIEPQ